MYIQNQNGILFLLKMPEAEAKKKAYEYMRKKMGLTADIPKALINRMKDNQKIMGDRAGNIKIRNIGGN